VFVNPDGVLLERNRTDSKASGHAVAARQQLALNSMVVMQRAAQRNGQVVLYRVGQLATMLDLDFPDRRRVARCCIECALAESGLLIYSNVHVPASQGLYHDAQGDNHFSVGLYQQQVPMWGSAETCMDPLTSTDSFVNALLASGNLHVSSGVSRAAAIQSVQNSSDEEGDIYARQSQRARRFVEKHQWWWTETPSS
jgi:hypothetical protein